jgi:hypothetical protein
MKLTFRRPMACTTPLESNGGPKAGQTDDEADASAEKARSGRQQAPPPPNSRQRRSAARLQQFLQEKMACRAADRVDSDAQAEQEEKPPQCGGRERQTSGSTADMASSRSVETDDSVETVDTKVQKITTGGSVHPRRKGDGKGHGGRGSARDGRERRA